VFNMSVAQKSPLSRVKDEFGGKDKLVDKIVGVLDAGDEGKDGLRKRLLGVANGKLIRLFSVATRTKQAGGHDKLAATTAERLKHGKDKDYVAKLGELSDARLLDMLQAADRAQGGVAAAAPAAKAERAAKAKAGKAATAAKKAAEPVKGKGKGKAVAAKRA
jgi:hypothetical protein